MWTYVARRLLLMVVTLFGITIVTYGIITLTPGDPAELQIQQAQMSGSAVPVTKESIREARAFYGLDKPRFFNTNPTRRSKAVEEILNDLAEGTDADTAKAVERATRMGTVLIEPAVEALAGAAGDAVQADHCRTVLEAAAAGLAPENRPAAGQDWATWWAGAALTPERGKSAAHELMNLKQSPQELQRSVGTLASPTLFEFVEDSSDRQRQAKIIAALSSLHRPKWGLKQGQTPGSPEGQAALDRAAARWTKWWNRDAAVEHTDCPWYAWPWRFVAETQYGRWLGNLITLDFGESLTVEPGTPVRDILARRMPVTITLAGLAIFLSYLVAVPLGIFSAVREKTVADRITTVGLFILYSLPSYWVGNLLILYMTGGDGWLDGFAYRGIYVAPDDATWGDWIRGQFLHLVLPVACYTYGSFAYLSRQMRASMMETIRQDFIRTARAKGLGERAVVLKHALRNSLIPILTIMATVLPYLIGGSIIIEQIFTIEGMGQLMWESVLRRDYAIVMAITFVVAVLTMVGILLSDISYALADPRISYE
jgi:peptide/nickel transport system permease protein